MRKRMSMKNAEKNEKKLCEGFNDFILHCKIKNLSEKTIKYYMDGYKSLLNVITEDTQIYTITIKIISDLILYLKQNTKMSDISINTRLKAVRSILYYFAKLEYLKKFEINLLKVDEQVKETYTDYELKLLLQKPNIDNCIFTEYRDWVIINYILACGSRCSTVINLQIKHLNFEEDTILLNKMKNRKQQVIPMGRTLKKILTEYLQYRKCESEDDYLFCNIYGQQLTLNALENSIRKYNLRRGVTKTSLHQLRHTFAKKWIINKGDPFRLQKMLSHSNFDMTRHYVNMFSEDLKIGFNDVNPLESLTNNKDYIKMKR